MDPLQKPDLTGNGPCGHSASRRAHALGAWGDRLSAHVAELERKLNPRQWSKAESDAWHRSLPDVEAAFRALRDA